MVPFGVPPFQEMLQTMMEAGNELMKMLGIVGQTWGMIAAEGVPRYGLQYCQDPL
jgi:hypothetical protein